MKKYLFFLTVTVILLSLKVQSANIGYTFEKDTFKTSLGNLVITFTGHSSIMLEAGKQLIYVDPASKLADYSVLHKADLILITHEHTDHLDTSAIKLLTGESTKTIVSVGCNGFVNNAIVLKNGESMAFGEIKIESVPAYNIVNTGSDGVPYHPKGRGNGYIINFGGKRIYVAGDTEYIPEMANLKHIDVAFLPIGLPYNMTFQMAADAARRFMPEILYPYHFDEKNPRVLIDLLKDTPIKIRIRKMK